MPLMHKTWTFGRWMRSIFIFSSFWNKFSNHHILGAYMVIINISTLFSFAQNLKLLHYKLANYWWSIMYFTTKWKTQVLYNPTTWRLACWLETIQQNSLFDSLGYPSYRLKEGREHRLWKKNGVVTLLVPAWEWSLPVDCTNPIPLLTRHWYNPVSSLLTSAMLNLFPEGKCLEER